MTHRPFKEHATALSQINAAISGIIIAFVTGAALLMMPPVLGCRHTAAASVAAGQTEARTDRPTSRDLAQPPVEWIQVTIPSGGLLRAAVARPPRGHGPWPVVLLLHGSHGFAEEYVRLARDLARSGFIAVAACWFQGGVGAGGRFVTPLSCPDAPPIITGASPAAAERVGALVAAIRALPGARSDRLALFGHSRGGVAALHYALAAGGGVRALVLNSAAYPPEVIARAPDLAIPVLLLHGTRDDPADGGSAMTAVERARAFEAALRSAGKQVEVTYFEAGHNGLFASAAQYRATVRRVSAFLYLRLSRESPARGARAERLAPRHAAQRRLTTACSGLAPQRRLHAALCWRAPLMPGVRR